ncbi:MAG: thiamine biosynthesis protein ThiS [Glaciecola sp.]|jgi:thiamine biosynthesis protein ThiS
MTTIQVNGEKRTYEEPLTITELLDKLGVPSATVLVECNRMVLARDQFDSKRVDEGDVLELVRFVGGG